MPYWWDWVARRRYWNCLYVMIWLKESHWSEWVQLWIETRSLVLAWKAPRMEIPQPLLKAIVKPAVWRQTVLEQWEINRFFSFNYGIARCYLKQYNEKKKKKRHLVLKIDSVTLKWLFSKCFIWVLWNSNTCTYSSSCTVKFMNLTLLAPLVRTIVLHEQFLYHDMLWLYYGKKD